MQNLQKTLIEILREDPTYLSEEKLLKNKLTEDALKFEPKLIKYVLSDDRLKKHFFLDVDSVLVFDKDKFIQFVNDKQFLPDSYTSFKNTIGLVDKNGDYFKEKKDVVLAWPYKDCVLEGGQDKEDQKRDEIFYNEILAPDEIDRLFDPKVLTNFKRYDKDGEHPNPKDISRYDNLIIMGNNLLALHTLKKLYRGKVKLIYIDPPYNTGSDSFKYNDKFNHSSWLTFMKNRLEVAKEFLQNDGVIFIQVGDEELAYLKVLTDQIFGRENFISTITRVAKTASNLGTHFAPSTDYIICYANKLETLPEFYDRVDESLYKKVEKEGPRKGEKYRDDVAYYQASQKDLRPNQKYFIECSDGSKVIPPCSILDEVQREGDGRWRWTKETYEKNKHLLVFKKTNKSPLQDENGNQAKWNIYTKSYLNDRKISGTKPRNFLEDFINRKGADYIKKLGIEFDYSKPVGLIKYLIDIVRIGENDIVMDFFAGSGTTAEAVLAMNKGDGTNRKFIICEQLDYVDNVTIPRINKVIELNYKDENFVYAELKKWNQNYVDEIEVAETTKDLLEIYEKMKNEAFFRYDLDLPKFDEQEFEKLELDQQKEVLIKCLDKNQLYVNLSEMDDATFDISDEDKEMNRKFYGL